MMPNTPSLTNAGGLVAAVVAVVVAITVALAPPTLADEPADTAQAANAAAPAIVLPANLDDDVITEHLRAGEFDEALAIAEQQLQRLDRLGLRLYQHGMAQLGQAERTGEPAHYKDAGVSFMRVLVYFPRSRHASHAELELGYVHAQIGREDIARRLYDRAAPGIDADRDADYHRRLVTLRNALPDTPADPPATDPPTSDPAS